MANEIKIANSKVRKAHYDDDMLRLAGVDLSANALKRMYYSNVKPIISDYADWADNSWAGANPATHADDTTNFKLGSQSVSITSTATAYAYIRNDFTDIDLTTFLDGSASDESDYICFAVYCADITHIDQAAIALRCDAVGTITNYFNYNFTSLLGDGWNIFAIQKSAFYNGGSPNWNAVKGYDLAISSDDGTSVSYSFDAGSLQLVRKDAIDNKPNPFQIRVDGELTRRCDIISGSAYLGYAGSDFGIVGLDTVELSFIDTFDDLHFAATATPNSNHTLTVRRYYDGSNHNAVALYTNDFYIIETNDGSTTNHTKDFPVTQGDSTAIVGTMSGKSMSIFASISGGAEGMFSHDNTAAHSPGALKIYIPEATLLASFVASSNPLNINN